MAKMRNKEALQVAFMRLRDSTGMNQLQWGAMLGVSKQTISRWEGAHRLPTRHQAVGIIEQLRKREDLDPDLVENLAEQLGIQTLDDVEDEALPAPPAPAPPHVDARAIIEGALLASAEELDLSPRVVRRTFAALLDALVVSGVAPRDARAALTPQPKKAAT